MLSFSLDIIGTQLLSLGILILFEAILGIDNLVFLTIVTARLPEQQQIPAQRWGLGLALATRILFLALLFLLIQFTQPIITVHGIALSTHDFLLIFGGLFLLYKSTQEIHHEIVPDGIQLKNSKPPIKFSTAVGQIILLDIIFSIDSLFTAIGITKNFWIIAIAIWVAIGLMMFAASPLRRFITSYPSLRMLALSFLLMIGTLLIAEGLHFTIPKGYIYFSVCFSLLVELFNNLRRTRSQTLQGLASKVSPPSKE
jgi:predicted tellurium resistance membrane protein TerC